MSDFEHGCQFCYYEYFDSRAYPCSMCIYGEERKDKFQPKGKQNKRIRKCYECRWWSFEFGCQSKYKCEFEPYKKEIE